MGKNTITPDRYRQLVADIPEKDVREAILTSDATYGIGNESSMHILNQYFAGKLPTQQVAAARKAADPTAQVVHPGSTEPANVPQLPDTHVGLSRGKTPSQASAAFDKAYRAKQSEFFENMADEGLDPETRRIRANQEADRYVRMWWDMPRTAQGKEMPGAIRDGEQRILEAGGIWGKARVALAPKVTGGSEVIRQLESTGDFADALKARRLMTEHFTGVEEEDMRSVVRPDIRKQAVKNATGREFYESLGRVLIERGFESDGKGGVRYSKKVDLPERKIGAGYNTATLPAETIDRTVELSFEEIAAYLKRRGGESPEEDWKSPSPTYGAWKEEEHLFDKDQILADLYDTYRKRVAAEEDKIVAQRRQEDARSFQAEAKELVTKHFERQGQSLPKIPRGREGSEARAIWDAQPQHLKTAYWEWRDIVQNVSQQKIRAYDYAVYGDYLAEEMDIDETGDRMQIVLPDLFGGKTLMTIDYKPEDMKTQFFGGISRGGRRIVQKAAPDGGVAETIIGAGMRDIGGLIRVVADTTFKAFTYDVDEFGNPLNPNDWNYRFDAWTETALGRMYRAESGQLEGTLRNKARYGLDVAGTSLASIIPSRMAKGMGTGERKRYATGSWVNDVFLSIHAGRFLGDDFNELKASTRVWENWGAPWVPGAAGLMAEVALPLTPAFAVAKVSATAGRALQGLDASVKSGRFSDFYNAFKAEDFRPIVPGARPKPPVGKLGRIGRVLENPLREAEAVVLASVARNIIRSARGVKGLPKDLKALLLEEARLPRQLAVRLAGEMMDLLDLEKTSAWALGDSLKALRETDWGANARVMEIFDDIAVASKRLDKARKSNSIADLMGDAQGVTLMEEIAAQAAIGNIPGSAGFTKGVLQGYLSTRMTNELLNFVPNNYVMVTKNVIMPIRAWKRVRKDVQKEVADRLKVDKKLASQNNTYKFENSDDVSDLMIDAFGADKIRNTPYLMGIYKKISNGKALSVEEFTTVEDLLRGSIVKNAVNNSYKLTHTGAAWERGSKAALGRQSRLPRAVQDVMRAVRPIARIDEMLRANPTPPPPRLTPKRMAEGIELPKIELWNELRDKFAGIDDALRKEVLAARTEAGDAWEGIALVMQKYGSENPIDDIMQILLGGATRRGTGFFGAPGEVLHWDEVKKILESHLSAEASVWGESMRMLTPQAIIESIDFLRRKYPDALLKRTTAGGQPAGMGSRVGANTFTRFLKSEGANYKKIRPGDSLADRAAKKEHNTRVDLEIANKTDYADNAVWSFMVEGMKAEIKEAAAKNLARTYPEMMIPLSRPGAMNEAIFRDAVSSVLLGSKVSDPIIVAVVDDLINNSAGLLYHGAKGIEGGLGAADMRYILNAIIGDLYEYGAMNSLSYQRIADALVQRAGSGREVGLGAVVSRSPELQKRVLRTLERHLGATGNQNLQQLSEMVAGRLITDMVEANTGQTIDTMMGNLAATGLPARMDDSSIRLYELKSGLTQVSDDYAMLMPRLLDSGVDAQEYMLIDDLLKQSASGMLEANLEAIRTRDMNLYRFYISRVGAAYHWTRRATIGGLLGGSGPFPVLRFHGVNVMTAPFIMAITTPQFVLQGLKAIPEAAVSFVKPGAEALYPSINKAQRSLSKIPGAKGVFDWMAYTLSRNPNRILFVDKWGSVWTKARFDAAYNANNTRFSQVSFEFRDSIINELRRAASLNPNLTKAGYWKQIWRWFDPGNKTLWSRWAEESDAAFRKATFAAALKEGHSVQSAAKLSRVALLDYGAISKGERDTISKGMLFYAFRRQMLLETASTFLRAGDDLRLLRAQMVFTMNQHKMMDTWVIEEDWQRTRLYARTAESYDHARNYVYGPDMPAVSALGDALNLAGGFIDFGNWALTDQPTTHFKLNDVVRSFIEGFNAHPGWEAARDFAFLSARPSDSEAPRGMLRPEWVHFWQNTGQWAVMQRWFNLEPIPKSKRRHNEYLQLNAPDGTPMYSQWQFGDDAGQMKFKAYYYGATMMGWNRAARDWSTNAMIGGDTDDLIFKKRSQGSRFLHLIGMETQGSLPSEAEMLYTEAGQRVEKLRGMIKE
mgnify:FL=1|tara:strand:+ start:9030 stop:15218 length:6189 start_codon:yes stop_codon:yes gene_type:complete